MQLLATTYQNIWPFLDRTITVSFQKGKYLIKAPIGSGKSFMFFDGPVFGLYKYSGRTMLSMKAEEGYIKALFEVGGNYYLVVRTLTRTKSWWDGVKSKLFSIIIEEHGKTLRNIEEDWNNSSTLPRETFLHLPQLREVVNEWVDIENILHDQWIALEEVIFKNETDLQQNLADFLPPREVFTSTTFLMQDSENMFEMTAADRINVFKNIFWLLDIDEAKEVISNAKKDVTATIKSRKNTDDVNAKLQRGVSEYITIVTNNKDSLSDEIISHAEDRSMVQDKLWIENFDVASLPLSAWAILHEDYDNKKAAYQASMGERKAIEQQAKNISDEIAQITRNNSQSAIKIEELQKKLNTDNSTIVKDLIIKKQDLLAQQEVLSNELPLEALGLGNVYELNTYITELIQKGKDLKWKKEIIEQKLQYITTDLEKIDERKVNIQQQLNIVNESRDKQQFFCTKIDGNCPFLEQINQWLFKRLDEQKALLEKDLAWLDKDKIEAERLKVSQELSLAQADFDRTIEEYKKYDFKKIKEQIEEYGKLDRERTDVDKKITAYDKEKELQEGYRTEMIQLNSQIISNEERMSTLNSQLATLDEQLKRIQETTTINELDKVEAMLSSIARATKILEWIKDLVETHKNNMLMIKQLEEKEAMLGQLYTIFSKEIMIHVLQQTLPLFADVLNNLLAKVVDYTVSFETKNTGEKLELEIKVHDAKGERLVKSLSGWQKTILRLTWTLAICIFTRSNALFLDETVNNIDKDTIGKVADLIDDFTKTHDIMFYIITHSETIQEMEIWDKVISL